MDTNTSAVTYTVTYETRDPLGPRGTAAEAAALLLELPSWAGIVVREDHPDGRSFDLGPGTLLHVAGVDRG